MNLADELARVLVDTAVEAAAAENDAADRAGDPIGGLEVPDAPGDTPASSS